MPVVESSVFLQAVKRLPTERVPVWFMRQAGRYMSEYRAIREKHSLLEICRTPELAVEVTLQPVRALGVDAAILFSDLLVPLEPMGCRVSFAAGEGPVLHDPIRAAADVAKLRLLEPEADVPFTLAAIRELRKQLRVPLIGFAGAPFTLASYLIEGGASRRFERTKLFMYREPEAWSALCDKLAESVNRYLRAQIAAGAQAVQLFDSWVGCLSPDDYARYALPHSKRALSGLAAPTIHFGVDTGPFLERFAEAGGDMIGVDWRTPIESAFERLPDRAIQGNLDPVALLAPRATLERKVGEILARARGRAGFVFNLGHGILPDTKPEVVREVVEKVHAWRS